MEYGYDEILRKLKESLYNALELSQDLIQNEYVLGNNLEEKYVDEYFEIPLQILKLIRKL